MKNYIIAFLLVFSIMQGGIMISSQNEHDLELEQKLEQLKQAVKVQNDYISPKCLFYNLDGEKVLLDKFLNSFEFSDKSNLPVITKTQCAPLNNLSEFLYQQLEIQRPVYQVKKKIRIAVIDTGIDYTNPYLKNRIYRPTMFKTPKDFKGFDLVDFDFFPEDTHGHGTHVSGIIAGLFPEAEILPIRYYKNYSNSTTTLQQLAIAIRIAVHARVDIINISGGGLGASEFELAGIELARQMGILVVAAAGNNSQNSDIEPYFPASYPSENILSVMALDENNAVANYSNFGSTSTDIGALGQLVSYYPQTLDANCYTFMTGTSQATPVVSAFAGILWAANPKLDYLKIKQQLMNGADHSLALIFSNESNGKVNIHRSIAGQIK